MKKILVPTDFTPTAKCAIAYAAKLAQALNAELTLLNVQSVYDLTPAEVTRGKDMTLSAIAEALESESRQISKAFSVSCYPEVQPSHHRLSHVISKTARDFDLIVMGSDGPDDLYQFFAGSNTYNALIKAQTPLLLVPSGYTYSSWVKVVYAFDYLHEKNFHLSRLLPLMKALQAKVTILQVLPVKAEERDEARMDDLQLAIAEYYENEVSVEFDTIRYDEVWQGINSYILKNEPDVLALCSVHRSFIERLFHKSVIRNITAFSAYPVLVFHP